tara:strand:- start:3209 stop:3895 length:687 start_codon:yes stop_codon:yes gene_type:complete
MKSYNMKEASELLQVSYRTIRYYKGIFTNEVTQEGRDVQLSERFIELVKNNRKPSEPITDKKTKFEYKGELKEFETRLLHTNQELKGALQELKQYKKDLEEVRFKYKQALQEQKEIYEKKLGDFSDIDYDEENERIEVFTNEDYIRFEQALIDYKYQKQNIDLKEEHFQKELASKDELVSHYKQQSDYQKEQSDRILTQMEKLIEAIRRRDTIEAVEKKVIGKKVDLG